LELYRKYRPKCLDEMMGQKEVVSLLRSRLASGQIDGAYLASGPSGTGKSSLASALCGELDIHPMDYFEVLSQTCSVETVRGIQEAMHICSWSPGGHKLWLVDEAHTITPAAQGSFLSLLERIPPQRILLFTTTEPDSFPGTWRSRCTELPFSLPSVPEIRALLQKVSAAEGHPNFRAKELAKLVRDRCQSNMRTALQLLQDELLQPGSSKRRIFTSEFDFRERRLDV